jgi:hypothetical protein
MAVPSTEPSWGSASAGGADRRAPVQLDERRVLTCKPGVPAGFEVGLGTGGRPSRRPRHQPTGAPPATARPTGRRLEQTALAATGVRRAWVTSVPTIGQLRCGVSTDYPSAAGATR